MTTPQHIPYATATPWAYQQPQRDVDHLNMLSIFHFVVAGFALMGTCFVPVHYLFLKAAFSALPTTQTATGQTFSPASFLSIFIYFYVGIGALFLAVTVLNLLSGLWLRRQRHRAFSFVVAAIDCLQVPFGTVLGVFTIIVLARESVAALYATQRHHRAGVPSLEAP